MPREKMNPSRDDEALFTARSRLSAKAETLGTPLGLACHVRPRGLPTTKMEIFEIGINETAVLILNFGVSSKSEESAAQSRAFDFDPA